MFIYKITNTMNQKIYIGQTCQSIEKRFLQHSKAITPLGDVMRKYGLENFTIEIIEECSTPEHAKERERFWIKTLKSKVPNGYNQSDEGEGILLKEERSYKNTETIQFRIEPELKKEAEKVFNQLGLTFSSAYTLFTKAVVNQKKIPFEISIPKDATKLFPYNSENLTGNSSEGKVIVNLNE